MDRPGSPWTPRMTHLRRDGLEAASRAMTAVPSSIRQKQPFVPLYKSDQTRSSMDEIIYNRDLDGSRRAPSFSDGQQVQGFRRSFSSTLSASSSSSTLSSSPFLTASPMCRSSTSSSFGTPFGVPFERPLSRSLSSERNFQPKIDGSDRVRRARRPRALSSACASPHARSIDRADASTPLRPRAQPSIGTSTRSHAAPSPSSCRCA